MGRRNFGTAGPVSLQRTTAQKEPVEITITDQQRLEAEARLCVGCRPRWGLCTRTGSGPVKKIDGPLAGLVFLADDEQLLAPGTVASTRQVREPAVPHVQKISATLGLPPESCSLSFHGKRRRTFDGCDADVKVPP